MRSTLLIVALLIGGSYLASSILLRVFAMDRAYLPLTPERLRLLLRAEARANEANVNVKGVDRS